MLAVNPFGRGQAHVILGLVTGGEDRLDFGHNEAEEPHIAAPGDFGRALATSTAHDTLLAGVRELAKSALNSHWLYCGLNVHHGIKVSKSI